MNKIVIGNWKQNFDLPQVRDWLAIFGELLTREQGISKKVDIVIAAPFTFLPLIKEFAQKNKIYVAAQDISDFGDGAHTGRVGATQLKDFCDFVLVGHSELQYSLDSVIKRIENANEVGLKAISCFVDHDDISHFLPHTKILAWEDPKNISKDGVYNPKNPDDISSALRFMKSGIGAQNGVKIIYGGSVNPENCVELARISELDGVLPGNASLDPESFFAIVQEFSK